ncbi:MAG: DMT family transporter [Gemmobacter sp.]|nr:DMT family transporter [Gemmobacter sp.]
MTEWLISLQGTAEGRQTALWLALLAALFHAVFGALQKGRFGPWATRGAIDAAYCVIAAPFAFFVVPWPEPHMWLIFAGALVLHTSYKILQAMAYQRGAYTVVYPVVRGTGPLFAVLVALVVFNESFSLGQWLGLGLLVAGIFGLAAYNLRHVTVDRDTLVPALGLAFLTGIFVAAYTTYDAYGIRATADPFTFLAWFFLLDGLLMPLVALPHLRRVARADVLALMGKGVLGAMVAYISFGSILLATRIGNVGEAAVLRETSTVFAAAIGWFILGESTGPRRVALMGMIAAGAVIVKLAG